MGSRQCKSSAQATGPCRRVYYWQGLQCSADNQHPIIRVNHGTSEEPGMVTLTQYVNDTFPGVEAEHLPHGACFRLVGRL